MAAAANNPDFARRAGISQGVAREFHDADKEGALNMAFGGSSWVGNWGSRRNKGLPLYDLMAPGGTQEHKVGKGERKRRKKAQRKQERGAYGDEILTNVKNPDKRRALVRAGWYADTPAATRKGVQGAKGKKGKKYATSLNKDTTFYPPETVGGYRPPSAGGAGPVDYFRREIIRRDPASYISTGMQEGGEVDYQTAPGEYSPRSAEEVGPALEQMFNDMQQRRRAEEGEAIDYAWDKSTPIDKETNLDARLAEMSGAEQVQFIKPLLIRAMQRMQKVGQADFGSGYSIRDYSGLQHEVNLLRNKWTKALQQQAQESQAPTPEELNRIGVNNEGESIFMNDEAASRAAFDALSIEDQEQLLGNPPPGMFEGGLAPMSDLIQRGFAPGLTGSEQSFQEGGEVEGQSFKQLWRSLGGGLGNVLKIMRGIEDGTYYKDDATGLLYTPQQTILQPEDGATPTTAQVQGPRGGGRGPRGRRGGGGGGRGGGGGGGPGGGPVPDETCPSGFRRTGPAQRCVPEDPPRIIPPGGGDGGDGTTLPGPYVPPPRREGRDTEFSEAIRQHQERIRASLAVPPGGYAGGGTVRRYEEGGAVRPGHHEDLSKGPNPHKVGTASYRYWESRFHKDPPPPPPPEEEEEEIGWLASLLGKKEASETRTERELEEMEQAYGGYVQNYQAGGLAQANHLFRRPPMGGVPRQVPGTMKPRMGGVPPRLDPRAMPPQPYGGGATTGQSSLPAHLRNIQGQVGDMQQALGPGRPAPRMVPPTVRNLPPRGMPWRGAPPPRAMPPGGRLMPGQMPGGGLPRGLQSKLRRWGMQPVGQPGNLRRPPQTPMNTPMMRRNVVRPTPGVDPRGGPGVPPSDGRGGPRGGPPIPPNLRGYLQQSRMMNRPRRGVPGPAGAGGAPNRVGQSDQQGGLARALQRGTGRPPMSRRSGFYR